MAGMKHNSDLRRRRAMRHAGWTFIALIFLWLASPAAAKGYLFIIGGGDLPDTMMKKFVDLSSGYG
jgi:hypothetical protein